jgi:hypothetical protein
VDYFQGVVGEYLRADRSSFNNTEFYLQNDLAEQESKTYWYVDILNINLRERAAYLCEVTYAQQPTLLIKRLNAWAAHWPVLAQTLSRDAGIPSDWPIRPWLFVPEASISKLIPKLPPFAISPRITPLEMALPWRYKGWDRIGEAQKPPSIPDDMR